MDTSKCAKCRKGGDLKTCARCESQQYCSRACQMAHWKEHKKICNNVTANPGNSSTPASIRPHFYGPIVAPKNLTAAVHEPFRKLDAGAWLHERPEDDVDKLLIDTFRLRRLDGFVIPGGKTQDGDFSELPAFKNFMELFEGKQNLLPTWWSSDKARKCMSLSMGNSWLSLRARPNERDIVKHYGDSSMPDQMRILGKQIYGPTRDAPSLTIDEALMHGQNMRLERGPDGSRTLAVNVTALMNARAAARCESGE